MPAERDRLRELAARAGLRDVPVTVLVVCLAAAVGIVVWIAARATAPASERFPLEDAEAPEAKAGADPASAEPTQVVVHVTGCVRAPGVYTLRAGSRVGAAVEAAGGALGPAQLDALNLARVVRDGEQVRVPAQGEAAAGQAPGGSSAANGDGGGGGGAPGALVDLNSAGAADLEALPGVGPATAQKIVKDRETNGPFRTAEDLMRVPGIGPKKFESLKDLVTAG